MESGERGSEPLSHDGYTGARAKLLVTQTQNNYYKIASAFTTVVSYVDIFPMV